MDVSKQEQVARLKMQNQIVEYLKTRGVSKIELLPIPKKIKIHPKLIIKG
jgi:pullulanase/glycogen debranching enzyme